MYICYVIVKRLFIYVHGDCRYLYNYNVTCTSTCMCLSLLLWRRLWQSNERAYITTCIYMYFVYITHVYTYAIIYTMLVSF